MNYLDMVALARLLKSRLIGGKVDKAYQIDERAYKLCIKAGEKQDLMIVLPDAAYITAYDVKTPTKPSSFSMVLRKHLENARVADVGMLGAERVIWIDFDGKERLRMYIELFPPGGIVLVNEGNKVLVCSGIIRAGERTVRPNVDYVAPSGSVDVVGITLDAFKGIMRKSNKDDVVRMLAVDFGLGGGYAEEVCSRAGIDKAAREADDEVLEKLYDAMRALIVEKTNNDNINEQLDEKHTKTLLGRKEEERKTEHESKKKKLMKRLEMHKASLEDMKGKEVRYKEIGDAIYAEYTALEKILTWLKENKKSLGWEGMEAELENTADQELRKIIKIKKDEGKITVKI